MTDPGDLDLDTVRVPLVGAAGSLHVRVAGPAGATPVLLLHGFPDTGFGWRHQVPALVAAGYRVLVPDQRGYGRSDAPPRVAPYRLDRLVADAIAVLDDQGGGLQAHVVGHDWGGAVAWALAQHHPARVRSLTVLNCPPVDVMLYAPLRDPRQILRSWYILFFQLPWLPERLIARGAGLRLLTATASPEELPVYAAAFPDAAAWRGPLSWYRAALRAPWRPRDPVLAPTLVLWGAGDEALGDGLAEASLGRVRDGRLVRLDGHVGHWSPTRARDRVTPALLDHLARHGGADPWLYRLVPVDVWQRAADPWPGEALDTRDGFVHLSTGAQVDGTRARFFPGRDDVLTLRVDPRQLDPQALVWEPARDGAGGPFPHLRAPLPHAAVADP